MGAYLSRVIRHSDHNVPASPTIRVRTSYTTAEILKLWSDNITLATCLQRQQALSPKYHKTAHRAIRNYQKHLFGFSPSEREILDTARIPNRIEKLLSEQYGSMLEVGKLLEIVHTTLAEYETLIKLHLATTTKTTDESLNRTVELDKAMQCCEMAKLGISYLDSFESRYRIVLLEARSSRRVMRFFERQERVRKGELDSDDKCVICQDLYLDEKREIKETTIRLRCHHTHMFHLECACAWFQERNRCPFCRERVLKLPK